MEDAEFARWYGPWSPLDVSGVVRLLTDFEASWWIVGGQAIERFTGVRRDHDDIDVAVLRSDTARLLPILAAEYHVWANAAGALTPMLDGRVDVPAEAQQLWLRRHALSPWEVDFVVADERHGRWVWRHDPTVTMALSDVTWVDDDGVRFARAEIVLAHKAKWRTPKEDLDFNATWPLLTEDARSWLRATVATMYPDHPWLHDMS